VTSLLDPGQARLTAVETEELTTYCRQLVAGDGCEMPGVLVATAHRGTITYGAHGLADIERHIKITVDTRFEVGSIAKQITAHVLSRILGGDDQLDRPISDFIPNAGFLANLQLRKLADHRCAIRDYESVLALAGLRSWDFMSQQDIVNLLLRHGPLPSVSSHYSNSHYLLLAEVVKRASGKSLGKVAKEIIFGPYQMKDSEFRIAPDQLVPDRAWSYYSSDTGQHWRLADTADVTIGPHGLYSSAIDLMRWEYYLLSHTSLNTALQQASADGGRAWCLGRTMRRCKGRWLSGHSGARFGFRSALWTDDSGITVAVLANRPDIDAEGIADDILDLSRRRAKAGFGSPEVCLTPAISGQAAHSRAAALNQPPDGWYWSLTSGAEWHARNDEDGLVLSSAGREIRFYPQDTGCWMTSEGSLRGDCTIDNQGNIRSIFVIRDADALLFELEYAGPGHEESNAHDISDIENFVDDAWGIKIAWQTSGSIALIRTGRASHRLRQVAADTWLGDGMRVQRTGSGLTIDMPRARAVAFARQDALDAKPGDKKVEPATGPLKFRA